MRALRFLLPALALVGTLALWAGVASANGSSFTATINTAWSQDDNTGANPNGNCGGGLVYNPYAFGTGYPYGPGTDEYTQWAFGAWNAAVGVPAGATLLGATLSGALAQTSPRYYEGDYVLPVGTYGFYFGSGAGIPFTTGRNQGCTYPIGSIQGTGSAAFPANKSPVAFSAGAYALAQTYLVSGTADLFFGASDPSAVNTDGQIAGEWLAPKSSMTLSLDYAFTPTGINAAQESPPTASTDTQATISWNPNGNDSGTTYTLQRETLNAGGVVAGWTTMYQGTATSVTTNSSWWSQSCGYGYQYRVEATGPSASTPWDTSAQWDEFPCTASVVGATTTSVTVSWPQVTPQTVPEVVWCEIGTPAGGVSCQQQRFDIGAGSSSATITGLVPNAEYVVWACSATNAWGCPNPIGWTYAAQPTLSINNNTSGLAYDQQPLTWTTNGNAPGTVYCLQQGTYAQSGAWQGGTCAYYGTATSAVVDQTAGTSYAYQVWANNAGYSGASSASNSVQTQVASTPTLTVTGATTATMSWPVVAYMVTTGVVCNIQDSGNWFYPGQATGGATSLQVTGLQPNTEYECTTFAEATNQGIQWWQGQAGGPAYTDATAPAGATLGNITQTAVTMSWSADGNPAGTRYGAELYLCANTTSPVAGSGWSAATTWQATGLQPGTCYVGWVAARNNAGVGTGGDWTQHAPTVPAQPTGVTGVNGGLGWSPTAGRGYVNLSWYPATGATGYDVLVWDGATYEVFNVGTATSWSSQAALIYPPDAALYPNVSEGGTAPPVFSHNGGGLNLRDLPHDLYCTTGTYYCTGGGGGAQNYWFAVDAYNASGNSDNFQQGCGGDCYQPTLPGQTDPNAPLVSSWSINGAGAYTYSSTVSFGLDATESPSGIAAYALSNDGSTWTTFAVGGCSVGQVAACGSTLSATGTWTLTPGPGSKTVWARVESAAGVWSAPAATTVYVNVDQTVPTVNVTLDGGAGSTASTAVTVGVTVSDPVARRTALTWQARYSTDGGQTWSAWQAEGSAMSWSTSWSIPGGASGERTVLVQVQNSDDNLGQGGATIYYAAAGSGGGAALPTGGGGAGHACTWPVGGADVAATCVTSSQVTVPLSPPVRAVEMRLSLDDATWGPWQATASSVAVDLGAAAGAKTVWLEYRDAGGAVTAEPPVYYIYDPAGPTLRASWAGDASATDSGGHATLGLQATDDVGTTGMTVTVTENGGTLYQGAYANTLPLTLTGSGYQQVVVSVTDAGGTTTSVQIGIYVQ